MKLTKVITLIIKIQRKKLKQSATSESDKGFKISGNKNSKNDYTGSEIKKQRQSISTKFIIVKEMLNKSETLLLVTEFMLV